MNIQLDITLYMYNVIEFVVFIATRLRQGNILTLRNQVVASTLVDHQSYFQAASGVYPMSVRVKMLVLGSWLPLNMSWL